MAHPYTEAEIASMKQELAVYRDRGLTARAREVEQLLATLGLAEHPDDKQRRRGRRVDGDVAEPVED